MTEPRADETEAARRLVMARIQPLVSEAHALSYALVMALASTQHDELTRREIDALCQVAYELLEKLGKALECFEEGGRSADP
jgi:hypothetical protein